MEKEIWAAIIQAVPVTGAAIAGVVGLSTWRKQLREGRQVEHAEKALAAAAQMFPEIRAARSPMQNMAEDEFDNPPTRAAARKRITMDRLNRAAEACGRFQDHYALARLFIDPAKSRLDVAREVADCVNDLIDNAETVWDDTIPQDERVIGRKAFFGYPKPDPIEKRLSKAEAALEAELRPILLPKSRWRIWRNHQHEMNIKRGLWRLWFIISVGYMAWAAMILISEGILVSPMHNWYFESLSMVQFGALTATILFGPQLALLGAVALLVWIARGFGLKVWGR